VSECNATLTTATETEGRGVPRGVVPPDGVYRIKDGVIVANVKLHRTMTCKRSRACTDGQHRCWSDDWDGATPHAEPLVSDAEIEAARRAFRESDDRGLSWNHSVYDAVKAAAKARQNTEGNKT
jgi:hypothetical protein